MLLKPKLEVSVLEVRGKFGIGEGEKVVLIASGSQGTGVDEGLIQEFIGRPFLKVIAVCGKNKELFEDLSEKLVDTNAQVLGYHTPMDELYAVADVFITKPGGLSVSEALRWEVPIIISHLLPGQEQWNYKYLLKHRLVMPNTTDIAHAVLAELKTSAFKKHLKESGLAAGLFNGQKTLVEAVDRGLNL